MEYLKTVKGIFIDRPNRFIAHVEVEGKIETVHVKNTGRCKELLIPGSTVILEDFSAVGSEAGKSLRKTKYDLIAVYKQVQGGTLLINMDSQAPNKVVLEYLKAQKKEKAFDYIKPEYTYGNSRVDFYMERGNEKFLMEVKGCTLERNGTGYFPDAPTERGVKHLYELAKACGEGYRCYLAFVIQIPGVKVVLPNVETHPEFGVALEAAKKAGVEVLFLQCNVWENRLEIFTP